jgi:hypothetical protein
MGLNTWSTSELKYGRKVLVSGLEGARSGREAFLHGQDLTPFLGESVRNALKPAAMGACLGVLAGCSGRGHKSIAKVLAFSLLGSVIGFGAGVIWENRSLAASVADGALRNIDKVRDERWLERHPIDYA